MSYVRITVEPLFRSKVVFNETHPDWKARACMIFKDHNVLQEGLHQAQILTNTVCLPDDYSDRIVDLVPDVPEYLNDIIKR